jgi:hypothetical protein
MDHRDTDYGEKQTGFSHRLFVYAIRILLASRPTINQTLHAPSEPVEKDDFGSRVSSS